MYRTPPTNPATRAVPGDLPSFSVHFTHRDLTRTLLTLLTVLAAWLAASTAKADQVLLLPAKGQVPGKAITGVLARESRYAVVEAGHKLVSDVDTDAAILSVEDGEPDNADEFEAMTSKTHADWLVIPKILPFPPGYGLELTAFQASSGRTETVVREIETAKIHDQVVEMVKLLLRPEGIGTEALPWEGHGQSGTKQTSGDTSTHTQVQTTAPSGKADGAFVVGLGVGASSCLSDKCGDSSAALLGELSAGWRATPGLVLQVDVRNYFGDDAQGLQAEAGARYTAALTESGSFGLGAELAVGGVVTDPKALTVRASPLVDVGVSQNLHLQATLGDVTWVHFDGGSVILAGGTLRGVMAF